MAAGSFQSIADAVLTKRMQPGLAAKGGVLAALLAERGITGPRNTIDGEYGIFNLYLRGESTRSRPSSRLSVRRREP